MQHTKVEYAVKEYDESVDHWQHYVYDDYSVG